MLLNYEIFLWQEVIETSSCGVKDPNGIRMREAEFYLCQLQERSHHSSGLSFASFMMYLLLRLQEFPFWSSCFIWRVAVSDLPVFRVSLEKGAILILQWGSRISWNQDHSVRKLFWKQSWEEGYLCGSRIFWNILWKKVSFHQIYSAWGSSCQNGFCVQKLRVLNKSYLILMNLGPDWSKYKGIRTFICICDNF